MARNNIAESMGIGLDNQAMPLAPELVLLMKEEVGRIKDQNLPVNRAFEVIAKKSGLKFNTVRNYYYRYIHEKDNKTRNNNHSKNSKKNRREQGVAGNSFKESEVRNLVINMLRAQARGESVRSCANRLANNDPKLMLRYQNKYRNIIANKQQYVKQLMQEMDSKGIDYYDPFRKVYVSNSNAAIEYRDKNLISQAGDTKVDFENMDSDELLGIVGELMGHMREINGDSLSYFFKGLRDISRMAAQWKNQQGLSAARENVNDLEQSPDKYREVLKEKDLKIQELNAKVLSYESRLEDYKKKVTRLMFLLHQLMNVNRNFLSLSSAGKLTSLQEYTKELEGLIKGYDAQIAE